MQNAIIIAPNRHPRDWFKKLLEQVVADCEVSYVNSFAQAGPRLSFSKGVDFVFISSLFSDNEIAEFLDTARMGAGGQNSVYVMLMTRAEYNAGKIAKCMAYGIHGFLCEPCSVADLMDTIAIATKMQSQSSKARLKAASDLMVSSLVNDYLSGTFRAVKSIDETSADEYLERCRKKYREVTGESLSKAVVATLENLPRGCRPGTYDRIRRRLREIFLTRVAT